LRITPQRTSREHGGQSPDNSTATSPALRAKIEQLLPALTRQSGSYRLSKYVNDEGSYDESITVDLADQRITFRLFQGERFAPAPKSVATLYELAVGHPLVATTEK
jgi:hypothetical protein